ncbi:MAG TPA: AIR synthase related protein, partial [Glaciihabitans sp.]|nr:AIR synthase related protein [Glaciihabitans sp.]
MTAPPGGCGRKLDAASLTQLLRASGFEHSGTTSFADSVMLQRPQSPRLHSSVDLIFDMGLGGDVTGSVAVVHALSDLYTSFCLPLSATLCLGLSHRAKTDGSAAQLLGAARATLLNHGVQFGGGHTVYNDTMFLSVSVVGERLTKREPVFRPGREYDILISKPIGTGIYLSANRSGLLSAEDLDGLRSHLMVTNEEASQEALGVLENGRGHLAMLTDVTGFGLLQTLRVGLPADVVATVNAEFVPLLPRTVDLIENHGITTSLGDA